MGGRVRKKHPSQSACNLLTTNVTAEWAGPKLDRPEAASFRECPSCHVRTTAPPRPGSLCCRAPCGTAPPPRRTRTASGTARACCRSSAAREAATAGPGSWTSASSARWCGRRTSRCALSRRGSPSSLPTPARAPPSGASGARHCRRRIFPQPRCRVLCPLPTHPRRAHDVSGDEPLGAMTYVAPRAGAG